MLHEKLRRLVKQWTPRQFRAPADFYQTALHQILQHTFDSNAADRFDICPGNGLAIGGDGECLERRRRQSRRFRAWNTVAYASCSHGLVSAAPVVSRFR